MIQYKNYCVMLTHHKSNGARYRFHYYMFVSWWLIYVNFKARNASGVCGQMLPHWLPKIGRVLFRVFGENV